MNVRVGLATAPLVLQVADTLLVGLVPVVLVDLVPMLLAVAHPGHVTSAPPGDGALGGRLIHLVARLDGVRLPRLGSAQILHPGAVAVGEPPLCVADAAADHLLADVVATRPVLGVGVRLGVLVPLGGERRSRLRTVQGSASDERRAHHCERGGASSGAGT